MKTKELKKEIEKEISSAKERQAKSNDEGDWDGAAEMQGYIRGLRFVIDNIIEGTANPSTPAPPHS